MIILGAYASNNPLAVLVKRKVIKYEIAVCLTTCDGLCPLKRFIILAYKLKQKVTILNRNFGTEWVFVNFSKIRF